jgi:hypothetical protein
MLSLSSEEALMSGVPCVEQDIVPMAFEKPPVFELAWSDSGNSVAVYLNGHPWALIDEDTHQGYSKGVLRPSIGNPWNEVSFRRFLKRS